MDCVGINPTNPCKNARDLFEFIKISLLKILPSGEDLNPVSKSQLLESLQSSLNDSYNNGS